MAGIDMNEFLLVFGIALFASFLTYLGAPLAERFDVPHIVVSGALQFAAGIITALVAFSLMPYAVRHSTPQGVVLGFFAGGAIFVAIDYFSAVRAAQHPAPNSGAASMGLYIGILVDLVIDGVVIGIGSTLTLATGLLLALGLAVSTAPLTFVTTATAKRQGIPKRRRQQLRHPLFPGRAVWGDAGFPGAAESAAGNPLIPDRASVRVPDYHGRPDDDPRGQPRR